MVLFNLNNLLLKQNLFKILFTLLWETIMYYKKNWSNQQKINAAPLECQVKAKDQTM